MLRRLEVQSVDICYTNKHLRRYRLHPKVQSLSYVLDLVLSIDNSNQLNIYTDYPMSILHTSCLSLLLQNCLHRLLRQLLVIL